MAWNVVYRGTFYTVTGSYIYVNIYEQDNMDPTVNLRITSVTIENNYKGDTIPIVGAGATVEFVNDGDFTDFDHLLSNYEKQFKCNISDSLGNFYFEGFLICDLNEQELLPYSTIRLKFANYLQRLKNGEIELNQNTRSTIFDLIIDCLDLAGFVGFNLYINSSLFHTGMSTSAGYSFITQTYVEHDVFFKNPEEYDNAYDMLNKILLPFNCYIYYYDNNFYIERYEDINSTDDWIEYVYGSVWENVGNVVTNKRQVLNKQSDNISYVEMSQVLYYSSGAQKLKVNLNSSPFDSLIFNSFPDSIINTVSTIVPAAGTMVERTWYFYEDATGTTEGYNYMHFVRYFSWSFALAGDNDTGIHYAFRVQLNTDNPTALTIRYKAAINTTIGSKFKKLWHRFFLTIGRSGSPYAGRYIYEDSNGDTKLTTTPTYYEFDIVDEESMVTGQFEISKVINLDDIAGDLADVETFYLSIMPTWYQFTTQSSLHVKRTNYVGDFKVTINPDPTDNLVEATITDDFLKTIEYDLDVFDVANLNYRNGLLYEDPLSSALVRTSEWYSKAEVSNHLLVDKYIESKFKKLNKTTKSINTRIKYNGYIKPFAIFTDNNIEYDSSNLVPFLITGYKLDLERMEYDIEMEEYPDTEIILTE